MTYEEIKNAIENGEYDAYSDRVDVSITISLFEYGILRNPKTNEVIFCQLYTNEEPEDDQEIQLIHSEVTLDEVRDYLIEDSCKGFFTFIGSDLATELDRLDNDNLAHIINSINAYDGWFNN